MNSELKTAARRLDAKRLDAVLGLAIFVLVLVIFLVSRVHQLADSNYTILLSESLIHHHSFTLDGYRIPRLPPKQQLFHASIGNIYQLEYAGNHIYYFWPPGSSVLSVPFVGLMNVLGTSAATADGTYNPDGEVLIQARLAALLMAALAVVFYFIGRLFLPTGWSLLLALGAALGTQIWSTASRALWSETWGILLLGLAILLLIAHETRRYKLRPALLATLLAWTYFTRPTFAIPIVAVTIYILLYHRKLFLTYAVVGAGWFAVFAAYSWYHFGQLLPNYYFVYQHFGSSELGWALLGNLISPSRGLLIYVPVLVFTGYLLIRYWSTLPVKRLVILALAVVAVHLIVVSSHSPWYGGHCYGPRYSTGIVPWFFLLSVAGVQASESERAPSRGAISRKIELSVGAILLLMSMTINGLGATSHATWLWNSRPINVDVQPERVWDWRHPQFLAKWIP